MGEATTGTVAVLSAWREECSILAPAVSSLVAPCNDIPELEQQTVIDVTGSTLANNMPTASDSLLWTLLVVLTLNSAIESTGTLLQPTWRPPVSPVPVVPPTKAPTAAPTAAPREAPTEASVTPLTKCTDSFQDGVEEGFDSFLPDIAANGMDSTLEVKSGSYGVKLKGRN